MKSSPYSRRIIMIVIMVVVISIILLLISYNFFIERDMRINTELKSNISKSEKMDDISDERIYHLIYDSNDTLSLIIKDEIERILKVVKVKHTVSDITNMRQINDNDFIILTVRNWTKSVNQIDTILSRVSNGASLIVTSLPGEDAVFIANAHDFGIYEIGDTRECESLKVVDDVILGLQDGDMLTTTGVADLIFNIHVDQDTRVYMTDEKAIPLYFTKDYGKGKIGIYNGENIEERFYDGLTMGMLGTMNDDFIYPIINSAVMFIDDWPAPLNIDDDTIYEQYGMNFDDFLKYIWWPDMVGLLEKFNIKFTGTFVLTYNDVQKPPFDVSESVASGEMYVHYQQIITHGGEICLHGYNHQPFWFSEYIDESLSEFYKPWESKKDAVQAVQYAIESFNKAFAKYEMNCYVPPSNVIDEKGIEVVKEALGTPVMISALFSGNPPQEPSHNYEVKDDVIYFPRLTSGSVFDDNMKLGMTFGLTSYGVLSHFFHPDDVINEERSGGMEWEQLRLEYDEIFGFIEERYPFLEYETISDCGNNLVDWFELDYKVLYRADYIKIASVNTPEEYSMILRTEKNVLEGEGYSFEKLSDRTFYISITEPNILINLEGEG